MRNAEVMIMAELALATRLAVYMHSNKCRKAGGGGANHKGRVGQHLEGGCCAHGLKEVRHGCGHPVRHLAHLQGKRLRYNNRVVYQYIRCTGMPCIVTHTHKHMYIYKHIYMRCVCVHSGKVPNSSC